MDRGDEKKSVCAALVSNIAYFFYPSVDQSEIAPEDDTSILSLLSMR